MKLQVSSVEPTVHAATEHNQQRESNQFFCVVIYCSTYSKTEYVWFYREVVINGARGHESEKDFTEDAGLDWEPEEVQRVQAEQTAVQDWTSAAGVF